MTYQVCTSNFFGAFFPLHTRRLQGYVDGLNSFSNSSEARRSAWNTPEIDNAQTVYKSHGVFSVDLVFNLSPSNNSHIYASIIKSGCLYTCYFLNILSRFLTRLILIGMLLQITLFLVAALQVTALVTPRAKDPAPYHQPESDLVVRT